MERVNQILERRRRRVQCKKERRKSVYLDGDRRREDIIALRRLEQKTQKQELLLF